MLCLTLQGVKKQQPWEKPFFPIHISVYSNSILAYADHHLMSHYKGKGGDVKMWQQQRGVSFPTSATICLSGKYENREWQHMDIPILWSRLKKSQSKYQQFLCYKNECILYSSPDKTWETTHPTKRLFIGESKLPTCAGNSHERRQDLWPGVWVSTSNISQRKLGLFGGTWQDFPCQRFDPSSLEWVLWNK